MTVSGLRTKDEGPVMMATVGVIVERGVEMKNVGASIVSSTNATVSKLTVTSASRVI